MNLYEAKQQVSEFIRRCYDKGLTTSTGGNISQRVDDIIVITPSGLDKSKVGESDCALVELETGKNLTPDKRISSETEMHRLIYLKRPDIQSIVHSHPTFGCLFSASSEEINTTLIAESWYLLGKPVKVPYELMGTKALAKVASNCITNSDILLLENHGVLTVGESMLRAFDRLECLEQAAKLTYLSKTIATHSIKEEDLKEIEKLR